MKGVLRENSGDRLKSITFTENIEKRFGCSRIRSCFVFALDSLSPSSVLSLWLYANVFALCFAVLKKVVAADGFLVWLD